MTPYNFKETAGCLWRNLVGPRRANSEGVRFLQPDAVLNAVHAEMRLGFLGDIMDLGSRRLAVGRDVRAFFEDCDAVVGNFEAMINPAAGLRLIRQRHDEDIVEDLAAAFPPEQTFLSVANNHAADFGPGVFSSTVETLERRGFRVFGQKDRSYVDIREGVRIATGSMWTNRRCGWIAEFQDVYSVPRARGINLLFPHWGYELELHPRSQTVDLGQDLLRKYDAIIGHHSHTPQPVTRAPCNGRARLIAYSLGDFCTGIRNKNYLRGVVLKMTLGPTGDGPWAAGTVNWRFLEIRSGAPQGVTNTLSAGLDKYDGEGWRPPQRTAESA